MKAPVFWRWLMLSLRRAIALFLLSLVGVVAFGAASCRAGLDEAQEILDGRTVFHWGPSYLAWVVHYPEDVVEPWVRSQTKGAGDPTGRMAEEFRRSLRMDNTTPVLLSVHCFGGEPVVLKPLPDKLKLRDSRGELMKPVSYEQVFDEPLTGLVQGLVFFPRVEGAFELVFQAPGRGEEVFEFPSDREMRLRDEIAEELKKQMEADAAANADEVAKRVAAAEERGREDAETRLLEEQKALRQQYRDLAAQRDQLRQRLDEALNMLAESERARKAQEKPEPEPVPVVAVPDPEPAVPGPGREQALDRFVLAWKLQDLKQMQGLLSPAFREELKKPEDLRRFLSDKTLPLKLPHDAKVEWREGTDSGKVIFASKVLFIRSLRSVTVSVTSTGAGWAVSAIE